MGERSFWEPLCRMDGSDIKPPISSRMSEAAVLRNNLKKGSHYEKEKAKAIMDDDSDSDDGNHVNAPPKIEEQPQSQSQNQSGHISQADTTTNHSHRSNQKAAKHDSFGDHLEDVHLLLSQTSLPNIEEPPKPESSQDWLERYKKQRTEWRDRYETAVKSQEVSFVPSPRASDKEIENVRKYNQLVVRREQFFEKQRRGDEWREIENSMKTVGCVELLYVISETLKKGIPDPAATNTFHVALAREAIVRILELLQSEAAAASETQANAYIGETKESLVEDIIVVGGIRTLCQAAKCEDSVLGSESVRVLATMLADQEHQIALIEAGALATVVDFACLESLRPLPPSKLLNICREAGAAVKQVAANPRCQIKVAEIYPLDKLILVAHCSDAVRRIYASDTLSHLLANRFCILKALQGGRFGMLAALVNSSAGGVSLAATDAIVPILHGGLFTSHFIESHNDLRVLVTLVEHKRSEIQEATIKTLATLTSNQNIAEPLAKGENGLFRTLPSCLFSSTSTQAAKQHALGVLQNLTVSLEGALRLVAKGFLHDLGSLLANSSPALRAGTVRIFGSLCKHELLHEALLRESLRTVISCVVMPIVENTSAFNAALSRCLLTLCSFNATHGSIESDGAVPVLVSLAAGRNIDYSPTAIEALYAIAQNRAHNFFG
eukprot:c7829_g1_i1.p1 GENE.c7829_g1_i1~~c7829_g1_i1.p1  ORF type:complete len:667 (-),score=123.51 c7829_g1_i1:440-2440(-)